MSSAGSGVSVYVLSRCYTTVLILCQILTWARQEHSVQILKEPRAEAHALTLAEVKGKDPSIRARDGGENLEPYHNFKMLPPEATSPRRRHPYKERGYVHDLLGPCSTSIWQGMG